VCCGGVVCHGAPQSRWVSRLMQGAVSAVSHRHQHFALTRRQTVLQRSAVVAQSRSGQCRPDTYFFCSFSPLPGTNTDTPAAAPALPLPPCLIS
jgi:hypothetical protein